MGADWAKSGRILAYLGLFSVYFRPVFRRICTKISATLDFAGVAVGVIP
jgi:hypothetical protein